MNEHWAAAYLNVPYSDGSAGQLSADGPEAFNCWGLVRWVFEHDFGVSMPAIHIRGMDATDTPEAEIREAARVSGWRPVQDIRPQERDIVLMWGPGGRHVGVAAESSGVLYILHSLENVGAILTPHSEMWVYGFHTLTNWRQV